MLTGSAPGRLAKSLLADTGTCFPLVWYTQLMEKLFLIQLVSSFLIGGSVIALLSIIAERANERVAGIIISFPTTIAIGFFFVGWAVSPQKVAELTPVIPAMEGVVMIFTMAYLYLSKIKLPKIGSMLLCTVGSLGVWFVLTYSLVLVELSNLWISLALYVVLTAISYYFITVKPHVSSPRKTLNYSHLEKLIRAVFAGSVITLAVYLSKTLGPIWGVVFSAFPAVYTSTMSIVYWHHDSAYLFKVWKNSPLGSLVFLAYALIAMVTFPAFGLIWGTVISYLGSGLLMMVLMKAPLLKGK